MSQFVSSVAKGRSCLSQVVKVMGIRTRIISRSGASGQLILSNDIRRRLYLRGHRRCGSSIVRLLGSSSTLTRRRFWGCYTGWK